MSLYQQLAELFKQQIQQNTWRSGERIPSVRVTSRNHSLSAGTVLQAYQLLESQGWIVAKPQSGYFVSSALERKLVAPKDEAPVRLSINDVLFDFLNSQKNTGFVKFGSAFPDPNLFPLELLNRSLASAGRKMQPDGILDNLPPGSETLRRLIAQRYIQQGMNLTHHDIVLTSGALEALNLSLQAVTQPGDTVVVEVPTFYGALQAVERLGLKAIPIQVDVSLGLCIDQLEQAFSSHQVKACWLMSNFQNPTGASLSDVKKRQIVALAQQYNVCLIEDDVYGELYFSETKPSSLKMYDSVEQEHVLHCGSLSKSLCPGFRLGWVVTKRHNQRIQKLQLLSTLSGSAPVQQGIAHYLQNDSYDNHLRKLRKTLMQRQKWMVNTLEMLLPKEVTFQVPNGGYFLWLKLPDGLSSREVYQRLTEQNITVAGGELFSTSGSHESYLRLNTSLAEKSQLVSAIKQIGELIVELSTV